MQKPGDRSGNRNSQVAVDDQHHRTARSEISAAHVAQWGGIIDGDLRVTVATPITGFVHAKNIAWNNAGATVRGALVTPGNFTSLNGATLIYDVDVINTIRLYYGSFVRVPGSWKSITF